MLLFFIRQRNPTIFSSAVWYNKTKLKGYSLQLKGMFAVKNLQALLASTAAAYDVSPAEVTESIRAYLNRLKTDPEFSAAWEEIPKPNTCSEEEFLLALMIADAADGRTDRKEDAVFA